MNVWKRSLSVSAVLVFAAALGLSFGFADEAGAQAYKYKDDKGAVHFTENYYEIPEKYRKRVEQRDMPAHLAEPGSPEAKAQDATPQEGSVEASFEDGLRSGMGRDLTIKQQDQLHAWMAKWKWPFIAAFMVNWIIALCLVIHALTQGHILWGLANFFVGVTSPFYLVLHLEQSPVAKGGILLLYLSPIIVSAVAMTELVGFLS
jgi:hypothetical protein